MNSLVPLVFSYIKNLGIKQPTKVDIPLNTEIIFTQIYLTLGCNPNIYNNYNKKF